MSQSATSILVAPSLADRLTTAMRTAAQITTSAQVGSSVCGVNRRYATAMSDAVDAYGEALSRLDASKAPLAKLRGTAAVLRETLRRLREEVSAQRRKTDTIAEKHRLAKQ